MSESRTKRVFPLNSIIIDRDLPIFRGVTFLHVTLLIMDDTYLNNHQQCLLLAITEEVILQTRNNTRCGKEVADNGGQVVLCVTCQIYCLLPCMYIF